MLDTRQEYGCDTLSEFRPEGECSSNVLGFWNRCWSLWLAAAWGRARGGGIRYTCAAETWVSEICSVWPGRE